jgi:hypothetical protein
LRQPNSKECRNDQYDPDTCIKRFHVNDLQ